jgi:ankyrin repeat protein
MVSSKVAPANEPETPSKQGGRGRQRGVGIEKGGEARAGSKIIKRAPLMMRLEDHERQIEELQKLTAEGGLPKTSAFALANLNKGLSEGYLTTPLHRAARAGDAASLESLLRDDSKKGVNRRDEIGWQPLLHAACVGQRLSIQLPLELAAPRDNATRVLILEEVRALLSQCD